MVWLGIAIIIVVFVVFINATEKVKYGDYGQTTVWLAMLGIYQWGQGLVLTVFWMLYGLLCLFGWTPQQAIRAYVLFHVCRATVEVLMTIPGHYRGLADVIAPHTQKITQDQRSQLYSLTQGVIVLSGLIVLVM